MKKGFVKIYIIIFIIIFPIAFYLTFTLGTMAESINGPSRIVAGPDNTYYVFMNRLIVHVGRDGGTLNSWSLEDLGLEGELADMDVGSEGEIYFGILYTGEVFCFYPEENAIYEMPFKAKPSASILGSFWKLMVGSGGKELYIAETTHKSISVHDIKYDKDWSIEQATSHSPATDGIDPRFHWPSRMLVNDGLLYVADSNHQRVMVLGADGQLVNVYKTIISGNDIYKAITNSIDAMSDIVDTATQELIPFKGSSNPVALSMSGNDLFIVTINPIYEDRRLLRLDVSTGQLHAMQGLITAKGVAVNPKDILAREDFLLVADEDAISIEVFSQTGQYIGALGRDSENGFDKLAEQLRTRRLVAKTGRSILFGLMLIMLVGLLVVQRYNKPSK